MVVTRAVVNALKLRSVQRKIVLALALVVHITLGAINGYSDAPNLDEVGHLPSGLSHWLSCKTSPRLT